MASEKELYKTLLDNLYEGVYIVDLSRHITFWNDGARRLLGYDSSEVIGERCSHQVLMHLDDKGENICKSNCPVKACLASGDVQEIETYLNHRDGHRVPMKLRVVPIHDEKREIIGAAEIFSSNVSDAALKRHLEMLEKQALLDPLTKVGNRRGLEMKLSARLSEVKHYNRSCGILFVDIDRFKEINDTYGHISGDEVLKMVAKTISHSVRPFDIVGRWGGEEFIALIADVDEETLRSIAERTRRLVEQSKLPEAFSTISVTVSIGATLARKDDDIHTLIERVDQAMYTCKAQGRNQVVTSL